MTPTRYAHPECLVEPYWLQLHLNDPKVRLIESNEDTTLYGAGHIPGAVHVGWHADLQDSVMRDYISPAAFAEICENNGISPDTTCVFYGDKANWWACYALWAFRLFGHTKVKVLNGGRDRWIRDGRPMTREKPHHPRASYPVPKHHHEDIRAFYDDALAFSRAGKPLIDVRSPGEFRGELTHMAEYPQEGVLRGGHIPGACCVPWNIAANDDGTFKAAEDLYKIYIGDQGFDPGEDLIVYCRIGERSSHTWFVLSYLLGCQKVRNYDGSWMEWGNRVLAPIERGDVGRREKFDLVPAISSAAG